MPIFPAIIKALVCAKKVFDVIERVPEIRDDQNAVNDVVLKEKISFNKVSFRYPTQVEKTRDIFNHASFEILAG